MKKEEKVEQVWGWGWGQECLGRMRETSWGMSKEDQPH
jgi:hypothetical protein